MAGFNFGGLEDALNDARGSGVSFALQAKKWETKEQGLFHCHLNYKKKCHLNESFGLN